MEVSGHPRAVLLPWGSQEAHGPYLPASTDTLIAEHISDRLVEEVDGVDRLPAMPYGSSAEHAGFDTTMSLTSRTLFDVATNLLHSLTRQQVLIVIVNGHGGNEDTLRSVCSDFNYGTGQLGSKAICCHVFSEGARSLARQALGAFDAHAGSAESSVMSAIDPRIEPGTRRLADVGGQASTRGLLRLYASRDIAPTGILTTLDEVAFNPEIGRRLIDVSVTDTVATIDRFRHLMAQQRGAV